MKLLIDDADLERIRQYFEGCSLDGVAASGASLEVLGQIRKFLGDNYALHVPLKSSRAEETVSEAERVFDRLGLNTYVEIPVNAEGLKAMKILLESSGVSFTATDVRTPMQAVMAGKCGASYIMPFVNRLDNRKAVDLVKRMRDAIARNGFESEVIARQFKTSRQAIELCECGISVAVPPAMLTSLIANEHDV